MHGTWPLSPSAYRLLHSLKTPHSFWPLLKACSKTLTAPAHGALPDNCAGTESGSTCQASCQSGFAGAPSATCANGTWGAWDPVCTPARVFQVLLVVGCTNWDGKPGTGGQDGKHTSTRGLYGWTVLPSSGRIHPLDQSTRPLVHTHAMRTACTAAYLPAAPANSSLPVGGCEGTASGSTCQSSCSAPDYAGAPSINCTFGAWAPAWSGTCTKSERGLLCLHAVGLLNTTNLFKQQRLVVLAWFEKHPDAPSAEGRTCKDVPKGGCFPKAKCRVGPTGVTCTCPKGSEGMGFGPDGCTDIDE